MMTAIKFKLRAAFQRHRLPMVALVLGMVCMTATVSAQGSSSTRSAAPPSDSAMRADRAQLERRFRESSDQLVREKLGLTDAQMAQLRAVNQRIDERRRDLMKDGRVNRDAIRKELSRGNEANQERVSELLEKTSQNRRDMLALYQDEQKELARFLTPVQRAQYQGIQEQLVSRIYRMHEQRDDPPKAPPAGSRPPGRRPPAGN